MANRHLIGLVGRWRRRLILDDEDNDYVNYNYFVVGKDADVDGDHAIVESVGGSFTLAKRQAVARFYQLFQVGVGAQVKVRPPVQEQLPVVPVHDEGGNGETPEEGFFVVESGDE